MSKNSLLTTTLLCSLIALALSGCGFHLRGKTELSPSLQTISVRASDAELKLALEDALRFSGANVIDDANGSGSVSVLQLTREDYERRVRTVDGRGLATSYYLEYRINFKVEDSTGKTVIERKNLRQRRDFNFDSTQVLQKEGEESFLKEDMQRDIAQTILRLLATVASLDAVQVPVKTAASQPVHAASLSLPSPAPVLFTAGPG